MILFAFLSIRRTFFLPLSGAVSVAGGLRPFVSLPVIETLISHAATSTVGYFPRWHDSFSHAAISHDAGASTIQDFGGRLEQKVTKNW